MPELEKKTPEQLDEFLRLFYQNRRSMFLFVRSLVLNKTDAEDIFQESCLVIWKQFDRFQPGTNFLAWAFRIIRIQTLAWHGKQKNRESLFQDEILERLADVYIENPEYWEIRHRILGVCLQELPNDYFDFISKRYYEKKDIEKIAEEKKMTKGAVYRLLSRIRERLRNCICSKLGKEM